MAEKKTPEIEREIGKSMKKEEGKLIRLKLKDIKPYKNNAKIHTEKQIGKIRDSIISFGYKDLIAVDENNVILEGHGRLRALYMIDITGYKEIQVWQITDFNKSEKKAYRIAHNKLTMSTDFDNDILSGEFNELEDTDNFNDTGFDQKEITEIWDEVNPKEIVEDIIEVGAYERAKNKTSIKLGEVYTLGNNRLMCGDSTESQQVEKLMNEKEIDLLLTDPPYGIDIVNSGKVEVSAKAGFGKVGTNGIVKAKQYKEIIGDDKPFDPTVLLNYGKSQIIFGANNFASSLPDNSHWLVWDKKCEKGADHNNFSDCELAWTNINKKAVRVYRHLWSGLLREGERKTELKARVHPTQKPVGLMGDMIDDYSEKENSVLDLFGGSGSTLIACEQLDRKCFMMELDPVYCQVIIDRWEKFTNKQAIKI